MKTVIFGSEGNVARRLRKVFPNAFGVDQAPGADLVSPMSEVDFDAEPLKSKLAEADVVLHFGTSPRVHDPDEVHYQAVVDAARLLQACQRVPVPRVLLPSSDWADPRPGWTELNTYGHSKRAFETLAAMYRHSTGMRCQAIRLGWVAHDLGEVERAEPWLKSNYWDDKRLIHDIRQALELWDEIPEDAG